MLWKDKPLKIIVDGRNLLFRCGDAYRDLYIESGDDFITTGGIYGFLSNLINIHQKYHGQIVVCWESTKRDNFRFDLYPFYKDRGIMSDEQKKLLEEVNSQQKRIKAILRTCGIEQFNAVESEADDTMGTLAKLWTGDGTNQAIIYTSDGDLRQCIDAYTFVLSHTRKGFVLYDVEGVVEKDGVYPKKIPDLKALAGDSSDGYGGVKGVGQVTAKKLVNEYGSIKKIIIKSKKKKKSWPVTERFQKMIWDDRKLVRIFKDIATIRTSAQMKRIKCKRSQKNLVKHLMYYNFATLLDPNSLCELMNMGGDHEKKI